MIDLILNIRDLLFQFFEWIADFFSDLFEVASSVGHALLIAPRLFGFLPDVVSTLIITALSIVGIYKILGREG